jgi:hypothetical protein
MHKTITIEEAIETLDNFDPDDQDIIIEVVNRRRAEKRRKEIAENIKDACELYSTGNVKRGSVQDLMREIEK